MNLATKLTFVRVFCAPVFFVLFYVARGLGEKGLPLLIALAVFLAFAEFTDFLDGYYARKMKEVSDLGKLFDPFADVILHIATFLSFTLAGYMPAIFLMLILYREFSMLFIRLLSIQKGTVIAARKGGKLKTCTYVVASFFSLVLEILRYIPGAAGALPGLYVAGMALYGLCVLLAYISFADYLMLFRKIGK
jgi:CDP-diacylglycerol--glycerol-3-phosphate 3-phosphatidyltransferase